MPLIKSPYPDGGAPFAPTDIAGLTFWLKADAGTFQDNGFTTPATANNDPVGGWRSQGGVTNDVTQGTAGFRPLLKTGIQNGKPALLFDGVDDYLQSAAITLNDPVTHVAVLRAAGRTNNTSAWDGQSAVNSGRFYEFGATSGDWAMEGRSGSFALVTAAPDGTTGIYTINYSGASSFWQLNANSANATPGMTAANPGGLTLASAGDIRLFGNVYVMEHCIYAATLTAPQIASLLTYLNARWAVY